jgi:hypothetical protein
MAISIATQQSVALSRVSNHVDSLSKIRSLLGKRLPAEGDANPNYRPLTSQLFVWQIPTMMLGNSIVLLLLGLAIFVFDDVKSWGPDAKV